MAAEENTTCDIYAREIAAIRARGDQSAMAELIESWYARCGFGERATCGEITDAWIREDGVMCMKTNAGMLQFCLSRNRWRLVNDCHETAKPTGIVYMMARIAEVTQLPFAYLCGFRDAIRLAEHNTKEALSTANMQLSSENARLSKELHRKAISLESVFVRSGKLNLQSTGWQTRYPDPPTSLLSWEDIRDAFATTPGCYFAWNDGRIVYVGATGKGMHSRLQSGHKSVSKGDMFSYVEIAENEVWFAETHYIAKFAPERNSQVAQARGQMNVGHRGKRSGSRKRTKSMHG